MLESAESEHPRLTNGEIIFEEFQPMWSRYFNVTEGWTDNLLCVASCGKYQWTRWSFYFNSYLRETLQDCKNAAKL